MSADLYQELGETGILVKINVSDADCDSFQGQVIRLNVWMTSDIAVKGAMIIK